MQGTFNSGFEKYVAHWCTVIEKLTRDMKLFVLDHDKTEGQSPFSSIFETLLNLSVCLTYLFPRSAFTRFTRSQDARTSRACKEKKEGREEERQAASGTRTRGSVRNSAKCLIIFHNFSSKDVLLHLGVGWEIVEAREEPVLPSSQNVATDIDESFRGEA